MQRCVTCQKCKNPSKAVKSPLHNIHTGYAMVKIGIDIVGPLSMTEHGNKYIIVAVDYFTKYSFAFAFKDIKAESVAEELMDNIVCTFGVPLSIHSDQGTNCESSIFNTLCELLEIAKTMRTPFAPWGNGETERMNHTLIGLLKRMVDDNVKQWDSLLPKSLMHYRSSVKTSTCVTAYRSMFGREMRLPIDAVISEASGAGHAQDVASIPSICSKTERRNSSNCSTSSKSPVPEQLYYVELQKYLLCHCMSDSATLADVSVFYCATTINVMLLDIIPWLYP